MSGFQKASVLDLEKLKHMAEDPETERRWKEHEAEMQRQEFRERWEASGMFPAHRRMTFETLDGPPDRGLEIVQQFSERPDFNLLLWGACGIRKTHLLAAAANILIQRSYIRWERAPEMIARFRKQAVSDSHYDEADEWMKSICQSLRPLFIDDLGSERLSERNKDFVSEKLYNLFDFIELYERKGVMLSSNCSLEELANRLNDRIASRIAGNFQVIEITGEDHRLKNQQKKEESAK